VFKSFIKIYDTGKIQLIVLSVVISFSVNAQTRPWDSSKASTAKPASIVNSNAGVISFGGGIGYSTFVYGLNLSGANGTPILVSETPAYNAFFDYGINTTTCIGIGITYQHATGTPKSPESQIDTLTGLEQVTRLNIGFRYLKYTAENIKYSFYYGGRVGISFWKDILPSYLKRDEITGAAQRVLPSIQVFCGYRVIIAKYIAFHAEFGIGTPYLIETGLSFRI